RRPREAAARLPAGRGPVAPQLALAGLRRGLARGELLAAGAPARARAPGPAREELLAAVAPAQAHAASAMRTAARRRAERARGFSETSAAAAPTAPRGRG